MSKIGELIVQAREERKLSQAELSKRTKISQVQISRIEGGEIKNPSFKDIETIAGALKIPLTMLADGDFDEIDGEERVKIGTSSLSKTPISLGPGVNLIFFENGSSKFSDLVISKTNDPILISTNQARSEIGLEKISRGQKEFLKNSQTPQRTRALTELLVPLSGGIERKTRVEAENALAEGVALKKLISEFKLNIAPADLKEIENAKEAKFDSGGFLKTSSDIETLISFQLFLEELLAEQISPRPVFIELNDLRLEPFLVFLLEEAESLKAETRLIVPDVSENLCRYFPWRLFVQSPAPFLTDEENAQFKNLTGSSALLKTNGSDSVWLSV